MQTGCACAAMMTHDAVQTIHPSDGMLSTTTHIIFPQKLNQHVTCFHIWMKMACVELNWGQLTCLLLQCWDWLAPILSCMSLFCLVIA